MAETLAIHGGTPVRAKPLPYGRQEITEADIARVNDVLRSDWLTTGPEVAAFEQSFAKVCGAEHAVAVSSGTAALHAAAYASGIQAGDEVILPTMTFLSTASVFVHLGAEVVFADVEADTANIDVSKLEPLLSKKTKVIVAVDFAGQPCAYDELKAFAKTHRLTLIEDAAHSLGADYGKQPVGSIADLTSFSLHPVKHITTGEGGMVCTDDGKQAERMRQFRNHGINVDRQARENKTTWLYQVEEIGFNYRLSDIQCALGSSQLERLSDYVARRRALAALYDEALASIEYVEPLASRAERSSSYHLYVVKLSGPLEHKRREVFEALRAEGIGVNVHYYPVHLQPFFKQHCQGREASLPVAETLYEQILSIPLFPTMEEQDLRDVVEAVEKVSKHYQTA